MFDWSRAALLTEQVASAECRANLYTTLSRDYDADSVKVDPSRRLLRMMRSGYGVPGRGLLHRGPQLGSCLNVVSQYIFVLRHNIAVSDQTGYRIGKSENIRST
jgi:hypothetical protein